MSAWKEKLKKMKLPHGALAAPLLHRADCDMDDDCVCFDAPTTVVNVKYHPFDIYIGRRMPGEIHRTGETDGLFGKPHHCSPPGRIKGTYAWAFPYIEYLFGRMQAEPEFFHAVRSLRGLRLGCWCKNVNLDSPLQPFCHGDVLKYVTDRIWEERWPQISRER